MIVSKVVKVTAEVRDQKTGRSMTFEVSPERVAFFNENGGTDFTFCTTNSKKVRDRWRNVIHLLNKAVSEAESLTDKIWPMHIIKVKK